MQQHVLVIENNHTNVDIVSKLVRKAGLIPVGASSLTEAKVRFANRVPEQFLCAVVAYVLPDAKQGEAIDFTIEAYIPTIVTTENLDACTRDKVLSKDVVDYIPKENAQNYDYLNRLLARLEKNKSTGVIVVSTHRVQRKHMISLLIRHNFVVYDCLTAHDAMRLLYDFLRMPFCHEEFLCRVMQNVEYIERVEAIRRAANTDYLTGLPNRRHFFYTVTVKHQTLSNSHALALIDLDHFKRINDTYGHDAGDSVLKTVGRLLEDAFSEHIVARFGGEEFCVYFPYHDGRYAKDQLDAFRVTLEKQAILVTDATVNVTCSIGIADHTTQSIEELLSAADRQLYCAKNNGRNQISYNTTPLAG